jgi:gluconate 2-dehydrogenase gamma chain
MSPPLRREWLKWIGTGGAAHLLGRSAQAAAPGPAQGHRFLTPSDLDFLGAAVDRLIPADDFPSAAQAGVLAYIDGQLAGPYGRGERLYLQAPFAPGRPTQGYQLGLSPAALYRESLDAIVSHDLGRAFATRPAAAQDAFLRQLEAGHWMLGRVPSAVFFETLLANTIEGYFADPMYGGNRDMAGWRMVGFPGAYAQFAQWVGRHGARFDRPPLSIDMSAPHTHQPHHPRAPASAQPRPEAAGGS